LTTSEPKGANRLDLDWEKSVPRCETCVHRRMPRTVLNRSLPVVLVPPVCELGNFYTRDAAICKHWKDKNGKILLEPLQDKA
jgi:hypothetical protein